MEKTKVSPTPRRRSRAAERSQLGEFTWGGIERLSRDIPVVFPIAAFEQHGSHMPLITDTLLTEEITRRAAASIGGRAVFAPVMWLGNSDHHRDFPGTVSASPRGYLNMLGDLAENFLRHGFKRLVFLNGHGGNDVPAKQALFEVRQRHRKPADLLLLVATYWQLADPAKLRRLDTRQAQMGHACEWETSMVLRLAPHLVGNYRKVKPVEPKDAFAPATRAWTTQDRTKAGHIGYPHEATAEKGEALLRIFTAGVVEFLERVINWDGKRW